MNNVQVSQQMADSLCSVLSWPHRLARYFLKGLVKSRRKAASKYCTGESKAGRLSMFSYVMGTQTVQIFYKVTGEIKEEGRQEQCTGQSMAGRQPMFS